MLVIIVVVVVVAVVDLLGTGGVDCASATAMFCLCASLLLLIYLFRCCYLLIWP